MVTFTSSLNLVQFTIDGLNLINNNYKRLFNTAAVESSSSTSMSIITLSNLQQVCASGGGGLIDPPLFISSGKSYIKVINATLDCFGNSLFENSDIHFENVTYSTTTFTNNYITLLNNSSMVLISSEFNSIYNKLNGCLFQVVNSSITLSNCNFNQISSPLVQSNQLSLISISNSNFSDCRSSFLPFITGIDYSNIQISNCKLDKHYSLNSSLISTSSYTKLTMDQIDITSSWFDFGYALKLSNSNTSITNLSLIGCYSQNILFSSTTTIGTRQVFSISNSTFINNNSFGNHVKMFIFNFQVIQFRSCFFQSNSFKNFIESFQSVGTWIK